MEWLMAERKKMTEFGRTLWNYMQNRPGGEINRSELAERLSNVGFDTKPANVSGWLNGDRKPPQGFVYYSALVLDLSSEERCDVAWSYLKYYKDSMRGRQDKNADIEEIERTHGSNGSGQVGDVHGVRGEYE